jgi:hypothetical protein
VKGSEQRGGGGRTTQISDGDRDRTNTQILDMNISLMLKEVDLEINHEKGNVFKSQHQNNIPVHYTNIDKSFENVPNIKYFEAVVTKRYLKFKLYCDRRSVGQFVSVSGQRPEFYYCRTLRSSCRGAPSLTRGRVCSFQSLLCMASAIFLDLSPSGLMSIIFLSFIYRERGENLVIVRDTTLGVGVEGTMSWV